MAIAIGAVSTVDASATQITITKPTGVVSGDLMVAQIVIADGSLTCDTLSGWTKIQDGRCPSGSYMASFYKVAGGSEGADYTFTFTGGTSVTLGGIVRITGGSVINTSSEQYNDTASTTATGATVTPSNANSYILFLVGNNASAASAYAIATDNPSWTEAWDISRDSLYAAMAYAARPQTTATGNATATISSSRSEVHMIVIKENNEPFTVADTTTLTDSRIYSLSILVTEALSLVEQTITIAVNSIRNIAKNLSDWINQDKSE